MIFCFLDPNRSSDPDSGLAIVFVSVLMIIFIISWQLFLGRYRSGKAPASIIRRCNYQADILGNEYMRYRTHYSKEYWEKTRQIKQDCIKQWGYRY